MPFTSEPIGAIIGISKGVEQMLNLKRMQEEWKDADITDEIIAEAIGMNVKSLRRKIKGDRTAELTTTQSYIICQMLEKPLDMFIMRDKER